MTAADRLTGAAAVWHLYVAFVLLLGAAYVLGRVWHAHVERTERRNRYAAPADVQDWRREHWL